MGLTSDRFIPTEITRRYELRQELGRPQRWETYLVEERDTGETCILRLFRDLPKTPRQKRCLEESYASLRRIEHPALAKVLRLGIPQSGGHYLVHEYVQGVSLRSLAPHIGYRHLMSIIAKILPALHLLHLNGIVHQRLSPDKLIAAGMDESDSVKIIDTGISPNPDGRRWSPPEYSAPEVANNEPFDGRADLYSLAVTICEVLRGWPQIGDGAGRDSRAIAGFPLPIDPAMIELPSEMIALLMRMGSRNYRARPPNAHIARTAIQRKAKIAVQTTDGEVIHLMRSREWLLGKGGHVDAPRATRKWLRTFCTGPIDIKRSEFLSDYLNSRFEEKKGSIQEYLARRISFKSGVVSIDWKSIAKELVESLTTIRDPSEQELISLAKDFRSACLPHAAARVLQQTSRRKAPSSKNVAIARRQVAISEYMRAAGRTEAAARILEEAAEILQTIKGSISERLRARALQYMTKIGKASLRDHARLLSNSVDVTNADVKRRLLVSHARTMQYLRRNHEARSMLEEEAKLQSSDRKGVWEELHRSEVNEAWIQQLSNEGRTEAACEHAAQSVRNVGSMVSESVRGRVLGTSACVYLARRRTREGRRAAVSAARIALRSGEVHRAAAAMTNIAVSYEQTGDIERAIAWSERSLRASAAGDTSVARVSLERNHAALLYSSGEYPASAKQAMQALRKARKANYGWLLAGLMLNAGLAMAAIGRTKSALNLLYGAATEGQSPRSVRNTARAMAFDLESFSAPGPSLNHAATELLERSGELGNHEKAVVIAGVCTAGGARRRDWSKYKGIADWKEVLDCLDPKVHSLADLRRAIRTHLEDDPGVSREFERGHILQAILWKSQLEEPELIPRTEALARESIEEGQFSCASHLAVCAAMRSIALGWLDTATRCIGIASVARALRRPESKATRESRGYDSVRKRIELGTQAAREAESEVYDYNLILESGQSSTHLAIENVLGDEGAVHLVELMLTGDVVDSAYVLRQTEDCLQVARILHSCPDRAQRCLLKRDRTNTRDHCPKHLMWMDASDRLWSTEREGNSQLTIVTVGKPGVAASALTRWSLRQSTKLALRSARVEQTQSRTGTRQSGAGCTARTARSKHLAQRRVLLVEGGELIYRSRAMEGTIECVTRLARAGFPILLCGESGTGKELLARLAHKEGPGRKQPFVPVDCPSLFDGVGESELFGHMRGAFSGATESRKGLFSLAHTGTVFLDEVGDLSQRFQAKLLRVLSTCEVRAIGSNRAHRVEFYLISATNLDIGKAIRSGVFRDDLRHRLGVEVSVPALRDRREDIQPLWEYFIEKYSPTPMEYEESVLDRLLSDNAMSGNVRWIQNVAMAACALAQGGKIRPSDLPNDFQDPWQEGSIGVTNAHPLSSNERVRRGLEYIHSRGRVTRREYAKRMGVSPRSALRDLTIMVDIGRIVRVGEGRSTRYVVSPEP